MDFNVSTTAPDKGAAIAWLASQDGLPQAVHAFVGKALEGFSEVGGNHPLIQSADPALAEVKAKGGKPVAPVAIAIQIKGYIDPAGGGSCEILVA